jgi:3-oxoacyl-[acyl-carrier-protein] synthase II
MKNGFIHKTAGYKIPDPDCDLDYCVSGMVNYAPRAALSNSLGFGGHNACVLIKSVD